VNGVDLEMGRGMIGVRGGLTTLMGASDDRDCRFAAEVCFLIVKPANLLVRRAHGVI
jgi:hypothetical protein